MGAVDLAMPELDTGSAPYCSLADTPDRRALVIAELKATDEVACAAFFQHLTMHDVRMRFPSLKFSMKHFLLETSAMGKNAAFAAFDAAAEVLGVANLVFLTPETAELAVIVRSDRHRQGIARSLLAEVFRGAAHRGLTELVGYIRHENWPMRCLARAMGFQVIGSDGWQLEVCREISPLPVKVEK